MGVGQSSQPSSGIASNPLFSFPILPGLESAPGGDFTPNCH